MREALNALNEFVHAAQKERGLVSLHLKSAQDEFSDDLEMQFTLVDERRLALDDLRKNRNTSIASFLNMVEYLPAKRKYIIARLLKPDDAMEFYSREIVSPAIGIMQELAVLDSGNHPAKVSAFINFMHWKERVGLERALGTQLIRPDWSVDAAGFKSRLEYVVSEQKAYERMFIALADEQLQKAVRALQDNNRIFQAVAKINQNFAVGRELLQSISAKEWFDLFTAKMELLHEIGKRMAGNLATVPMADSSAAATATFVQEPHLRLDTLESFPLFAGLDAATMQDILKFARVVSHNKGSMIFVQGEQAARFYIILEGWIKLFKGNVEGQESVLQVMTRGGALLETTIFSHAPFQVSAQAAENAKLLSIPASIMREKLQHDKQLAINMLSMAAGRSKDLISHFGQLTLKTVTQRVGWFLLKLFLERGECALDLKLPYDKSLIAGFLGMKPETFSRTLQVLKERGIDIDRNTVTLPDIFALCDYCDMDIAGKCDRAGSVECPKPSCGSG